MRVLFILFIGLMHNNLFGQKNIFLLYEGENLKVKVAVAKANSILSQAEFYKNIREHVHKFDNSELNGIQIAELIEKATDTIRVVDRFMPIANAKTLDSKMIKVSRSNFSKLLPDAVNTLIHETVHAIDWKDGKQDFTHSRNNNDDHKQDNTAPWVIGAIAETMVKYR